MRFARAHFDDVRGRCRVPAQPLYRDPWAKREAWRKGGIFSNRAMFRNLFPGFGIAVVAFTAYVAYDETVNATKKSASHH
ncbi:NADH dehydrogenase [ubiquinone] 1 beta subcomplex subunit 3 [Rhodotorula paludigena]|uniref:NADH dehydrogenase [ubiquinone] 1 beta subcomplex subunit 3 n=1 Tax=Rhodotorula paludigena TaxID=86838 RepID=UPI003179A9C6